MKNEEYDYYLLIERELNAWKHSPFQDGEFLKYFLISDQVSLSPTHTHTHPPSTHESKEIK